MNTILAWLSVTLIAFLQLTSPNAHATFKTPLQDALPIEAEGVLILDQMTAGSLPFLHGMAGEGRYITHNDTGQLCQIAAIRFIAGGLTRQNIGVRHPGPIQLIVYDQELSERIKHGQKTLSTDFYVTHAPEQHTGDIHIVGNLSLNDSFIVHPRRAWSSWFGYQPHHYPCELITDSVRSL